MLIAQLTDTHVRPEGLPAYRVSETNMMTERALHCIARLSPKPDVVMITGDITDNGLATEYQYFARLVEESGISTPLLVPGNHDRRDEMRQHLPFLARYLRDEAFIHYVVDDFPLRLVMLDTLEPGQSHGQLCEKRLAWLEQTLAMAPDKPTLIGMHHPPFATGIAHMDEISLIAPEAFTAIIARHKQVRLIVCGHVHRPIYSMIAHCPVMISPSATHQVNLDLTQPGRRGGMVLEPSAFAIHRWHNDQLVSHVALIEAFPGPFPFVLDSSYPGHHKS